MSHANPVGIQFRDQLCKPLQAGLDRDVLEHDERVQQIIAARDLCGDRIDERGLKPAGGEFRTGAFDRLIGDIYSDAVGLWECLGIGQ